VPGYADKEEMIEVWMIYLANHLYKKVSVFKLLEAGDADCDGGIDLVEVLR